MNFSTHARKTQYTTFVTHVIPHCNETSAPPGFATRKIFRDDERVEARDQLTAAVLHLRADAVQPCRHTLVLEGNAFRVLRVLT